MHYHASRSAPGFEGCNTGNGKTVCGSWDGTRHNDSLHLPLTLAEVTSRLYAPVILPALTLQLEHPAFPASPDMIFRQTLLRLSLRTYFKSRKREQEVEPNLPSVLPDGSRSSE